MSMIWSDLTHWFSIAGNNNTLIVIFTGSVAIFTFFQVVVGFWQWQQLKKTVNLARQEFISTHRPRMRIRHVRFHKPLRAGEPVLIDVVGVNTGDTEARIVSFRVTTHVVTKFGHPPAEPFAERIADSLCMSLASGKSYAFGPKKGGELTVSDFQDIQSGKSRLYCFACIEYQDSVVPPFPRSTSCCRVLEPTLTEASDKITGALIKPDRECEYEYAD